jgi:hypothetical protein
MDTLPGNPMSLGHASSEKVFEIIRNLTIQLAQDK